MHLYLVGRRAIYHNKRLQHSQWRRREEELAKDATAENRRRFHFNDLFLLSLFLAIR